jgi:hypothetical protein
MIVFLIRIPPHTHQELVGITSGMALGYHAWGLGFKSQVRVGGWRYSVTGFFLSAHHSWWTCLWCFCISFFPPFNCGPHRLLDFSLNIWLKKSHSLHKADQQRVDFLNITCSIWIQFSIMSFVNLNKFLFTLREGGFELLILVPQLLESWDYMCVPSYPANKLFLSILSVKCRLFLLCLPHRVVVRIRWVPCKLYNTMQT